MVRRKAAFVLRALPDGWQTRNNFLQVSNQLSIEDAWVAPSVKATAGTRNGRRLRGKG